VARYVGVVHPASFRHQVGWSKARPTQFQVSYSDRRIGPHVESPFRVVQVGETRVVPLIAPARQTALMKFWPLPSITTTAKPRSRQAADKVERL